VPTERFADIARECGSSAFEWATKPEDRTRLWQARHDLFWATQSFRKGARVAATDVCVPISRLAECIIETKCDIEASGLVAPIVAHAGDGNFHAGIAVMMENAEEVARARAFIERLAERSLTMEGSCTGEHGIGQGKKRFLEPEYGPAAVEAMRAIKHALDPSDVMNPGKWPVTAATDYA
jgi:D-lactate dehydrogenase (cytochrome)